MSRLIGLRMLISLEAPTGGQSDGAEEEVLGYDHGLPDAQVCSSSCTEKFLFQNKLPHLNGNQIFIS